LVGFFFTIKNKFSVLPSSSLLPLWGLIVQSSFNTSIYYMNVTWTPSSSQLDTLQIFCFQAQNNLR